MQVTYGIQATVCIQTNPPVSFIEKQERTLSARDFCKHNEHGNMLTSHPYKWICEARHLVVQLMLMILAHFWVQNTSHAGFWLTGCGKTKFKFLLIKTREPYGHFSCKLCFSRSRSEKNCTMEWTNNGQAREVSLWINLCERSKNHFSRPCPIYHILSCSFQSNYYGNQKLLQRSRPLLG